MDTKNNLARITIDLPKTDHTRLKAMAAVLGKSMREMVIEAIEEHLHKVNFPNNETLKAINNVEQGKNLVRAENADDLFAKLGI